MALRLSPERRRGSQELLAVEFCTSDGGNVVGEFSPCKPSRALRAGAALLSSLEGTAARPGVPAGSPCAVADAPGAPSTASQPSSATSSLAAALADLQVASRQSSENELGDQRKILAALGLGASALGAGSTDALHSRFHSRGSSGSSDDDMLLAAVHLPSAVAVPSRAARAVDEGSLNSPLCSAQLIGAVKSFDCKVLQRLTPIKTRSRASPGAGGGAAAVAAAPSPAAPYADSLASPFVDATQAGMKPKQLQPAGGRPIIIHSSSSSITAPGAYNPYDLTAAALSSEFRSPAKSLHSPFPSSSRTASTTVTPIQWGSASYRSSSYRALAAQHALAAQKDDEPDFYVSVPGVRRQQSLVRGNSGANMGSATAAAAAAAAQQPAASAPALGGAGMGAGSQPATAEQQTQQPVAPVPPPQLAPQHTLGSGTAVHGFKGLFRNIIVAGSGPSPPAANAPS